MGLLGGPNIEKLAYKRNVPALVKALGHSDPGVRSRAAAALGELGDRAAVEPLIAALADPRDEVVSAAGLALARTGDERGVGPLIERLEGGYGPESLRGQLKNALA